MRSLGTSAIIILALAAFPGCKGSGDSASRQGTDKGPERKFVQILFFEPTADNERLFWQLQKDLSSRGMKLHMMDMHLGMIAATLDAADMERFVVFLQNSPELRSKYQALLVDEMESRTTPTQ